MAQLLDLENLTVEYGTNLALQGLSLHLERGEKCALLGANGAGKTSLLHALVGVVPSTGTVRVGDLELRRDTLGQVRQRVGLVFQNPDDQLFLPTILQDVAFGLESVGVPQRDRRDRAMECLSALGIAHLAERSALNLSGGEKRMAALATVLVMEPEVLLLDEPTAFLDPGARRRLLGTLQGLKQTMLVATHDLSFALELCPRAVLLRRGEKLTEGPAAELLFDREQMCQAGIEDIGTYYGAALRGLTQRQDGR